MNTCACCWRADLQSDSKQGVCCPLEEGLDALAGNKSLECLCKAPKCAALQPDSYGVQGLPCRTRTKPFSIASRLVADQNLALTISRTGENTGTSTYSACQEVFGSWCQRGCRGCRCTLIKHVRKVSRHHVQTPDSRNMAFVRCRRNAALAFILPQCVYLFPPSSSTKSPHQPTHVPDVI